MQRKVEFDARWIAAALVALAAWQGARLMRKVAQTGFAVFWIWFWCAGGFHWLRHWH